MAVLAGFERRFHQLLWGLMVFVALSIAAIAILIPLNLLLVKMHWGNFWWLHEAVEYTLYVGVFLGAPWVLQQGAHVRVDVLATMLPLRYRVRLEQLVDALCAVLCIALCVYGVRMAISEFEDGTLPDKDLRIATWYMMAVFAFSFAMLALEFMLRWRRAPQVVADKGNRPIESSS
ncbi:MAG: TRAP transporter small permease [Chromatiales bacterium]|nr:TRAP transporter small permease [Chromatiales bacterium]